MRAFPSLFLKRLLQLVAVLLLLSQSGTLRAQVIVDLSIKRTLFLAYEPLLATVRITNLSGNQLLLADVEGKKWFGFEIETLDGRPIPPINPDYEIQPIQLGSGESISRTVNLTQLYPLTDFGSYRVRASVFATELNKYFSSPPLTVEITEGRLLWDQTVGVPSPDGSTSATRNISLLSHRLTDKTDLYLRIQDKEAGIMYCTHNLGSYISYGKPDILLDSDNTIHVLQNTSPREFVYSKVGLDGKILERTSLQAPKDRPALRRTADGSVTLIGGIAYDPRATPTPTQMPNLSDRPPALPLPSVTPETSKKKPKSPADHSTKKSSPTPSPTPLKID
jgi:hypothetical protein